MRGRATGFGARISSMGLLIALAHRTNHAVDERDLVLCDAVLLVEHPVRPVAIHRQIGYELEPLVIEMLGVLTKRHEKANETSSQVAREPLGCGLGLEAIDDQVGLGTRRAGTGDDR